jgi:arabinofuranosyltransferase
VALSAYLVLNPISPLKFGTRAYHPYAENPSYVDTKRAVWREGAAIASWTPGRHLPDHRWFEDGTRMRNSPERVFVGIFGGEPIGYAGFAAGPDKFIIDILGLSDPLLARLPAVRPPEYSLWKSGHFHRAIPAGYVESVTYHGNIIEDPDLREYYAAIRTVTRAPIWSTHRFREIVRLNLGYYNRR